MPKPYPQEFRDNVVKVARSRSEGVTFKQIAKDFGIHPMIVVGVDEERGGRGGRAPGGGLV